MDKRFLLQDCLYNGMIDKGVDSAICGVGAFSYFLQRWAARSAAGFGAAGTGCLPVAMIRKGETSCFHAEARSPVPRRWGSAS